MRHATFAHGGRGKSVFRAVTDELLGTIFERGTSCPGRYCFATSFSELGLCASNERTIESCSYCALSHPSFLRVYAPLAARSILLPSLAIIEWLEAGPGGAGRLQGVSTSNNMCAKCPFLTTAAEIVLAYAKTRGGRRNRQVADRQLAAKIRTGTV